MIWFVYEFFFLNPLVKEFFFLTYSGVSFFPSIIRHERYFFRQVFPCKIFPLEISLQDIFFSESAIPPVQSQTDGPLSRSVVPSEIKGPKNYVQLQHQHPIEI